MGGGGNIMLNRHVQGGLNKTKLSEHPPIGGLPELYWNERTLMNASGDISEVSQYFKLDFRARLLFSCGAQTG